MRDKRFEAPNRFEKMDIARSKKCNPQKTPRRLSLCDDSFLKNDHVLNEPYSNDEFFNCIFVYIGGQHSIGVDLIAAAVEMTEYPSLMEDEQKLSSEAQATTASGLAMPSSTAVTKGVADKASAASPAAAARSSRRQP